MLQVATSCATVVKANTNWQETLSNVLSLLKQGNTFVDAKCTALGAEIARLHRNGCCGVKRDAQNGLQHRQRHRPL